MLRIPRHARQSLHSTLSSTDCGGACGSQPCLACGSRLPLLLQRAPKWPHDAHRHSLLVECETVSKDGCHGGCWAADADTSAHDGAT